MDVVVVESPAKTKTIGSYRGADCRVLATNGHVSDLPANDGSVLPEQDFAMVYATGAGPHGQCGLSRRRCGRRTLWCSPPIPIARARRSPGRS